MISSLPVRVRVVVVAVVTGLATALLFAPWAVVVYRGAVSGASAGIWLGALGWLVALPLWAAAGACSAGDEGRAAITPGASTGALAAGLAGCLLGLPALEVWALSDLWEAIAVAATGDDLLKEVLAASVSSVLGWTVTGTWVLLGSGALAGATGAAVRPSLRPLEPTPDLLWPLLLARASVLMAAVCVVAGASIGETLPLMVDLILASSGLLGALVALIVVGIGVRHARHPAGAYRGLALLYALAVALSVLIWVGVPLVAAPAVFTHPAILVYVGLPVLGALVGGAAGWRGLPARRPEWRDLVGECALVPVILTVSMFGPGLLSVGLASTLPIRWILALNGTEPFADPAGPIRELFLMHPQYAALALAVGVLPPLFLGLPVVAVMRWLSHPAEDVDSIRRGR